jgi:hypothetical protein
VVEQRSQDAPSDEHSELVVLTLLLEDATPALWSLEELASELGDEIHATDAVTSLHGAGLVHRCGRFVFATRAATRFSRLLGGI